MKAEELRKLDKHSLVDAIHHKRGKLKVYITPAERDEILKQYDKEEMIKELANS